MAQFEAAVLAPALAHLRSLRGAVDEAARQQCLAAFQTWVEAIQLPHLGSYFLEDALRAAGAVPSSSPWREEAREAVRSVAWWSCPHAAVSSQGVVAWVAAKLQGKTGDLVKEPGKVYVAEDSQGLVLVERMIQPLFLQVPRNGHAERKAMVALLRSVLQAVGQSGGPSGGLEDVQGWVRLYASHYLCISCLASLAQFSRALPAVCVEVSCDNAWSSWQEREQNPGHVLSIGLRL
mmetsp:Transcript_67999/g.160061  ORF Transcript_67999/g.160061 Transcript_67999/m.160061 type:complete len:235 (+) Transcript_67999:2-706(+)